MKRNKKMLVIVALLAFVVGCGMEPGEGVNPCTQSNGGCPVGSMCNYNGVSGLVTCGLPDGGTVSSPADGGTVLPDAGVLADAGPVPPNPCFPNPCTPGTCTAVGVADHVCTCPQGWSGTGACVQTPPQPAQFYSVTVTHPGNLIVDGCLGRQPGGPGTLIECWYNLNWLDLFPTVETFAMDTVTFQVPVLNERGDSLDLFFNVYYGNGNYGIYANPQGVVYVDPLIQLSLDNVAKQIGRTRDHQRRQYCEVGCGNGVVRLRGPALPASYFQ